MTVILMIENVIRMLLQTAYNFISFVLQMVSLIPICIVFLLTARLKCFMCGGGGPCPVNRGGTCDCLMSALAFIILFFIFRATGVLDKIFYSLGYTKERPTVMRFVPTPGDITECSRNDTQTESRTETEFALFESTFSTDTTAPEWAALYETVDSNEYEYETDEERSKSEKKHKKANKTRPRRTTTEFKWTTAAAYYLV